MYMNAAKDYMKSNCTSKGEQINGGIDDAMRKGMDDLEEIKKDHKVVVGMTDKSGKFTMSSQESYIAQGETHTKGDKKISWEEVTKIQNEVNCHTRALANVFSISKEWGEKEEERTRKAMQEKSTILPQMLLRQKDHKPLQADGLPKTRAMCSASNTINQRVSDLLSDFLYALFQSEENMECKSTENFIYKICRLNESIREEKIKAPRLMIGSLDVEALYPSTDVRKAAEIVKNRILKSQLKVNNVDY